MIIWRSASAASDSGSCRRCTTHDGSNKPLGGAPMLEYYPELIGPKSEAQSPVGASS